MSLSDIAGRLASIESPCSKFACAMRPSCALEKLACTSFVVFAQTGRLRSPHLHYTNLGERPPQTGGDLASEWRASIVPTREYFALLDRDDDIDRCAETERGDEVVFSALANAAPVSVFSLGDAVDADQEQEDFDAGVSC